MKVGNVVVFVLVLVMIVLGVLATKGSAQSFIALGPEVSTTTSSGSPGGTQTRAGLFADGQFGFKAGFKAGLEFGLGGAMKITNRPRFFDEGSGSSFEFEPAGRMYFPIGGSLTTRFDLYAAGGMNMQRAASTTIANPLLGFGVRWQGMEGDRPKTVVDVGYKCLFDDVVDNALNPQTFRGYEVNTRVLRRLDGVGVYFQGGWKRQSNSLIGPPRSEVGGAFGILLF